MKEEFLSTVKVYESEKEASQERISLCEENLKSIKANHREELKEIVENLKHKHSIELSQSAKDFEERIEKMKHRHEKQLVSSQKSAESSGNIEMSKIVREHNQAIAALELEHLKQMKMRRQSILIEKLRRLKLKFVGYGKSSQRSEMSLKLV